ncbi:MAG: ketopantoate reductase family protein [Syntrophorhabdales bacterium]|jgi:2-dehydropantoate 2-reductase
MGGEITSITIVGAGAVGGAVAAMLAEAGEQVFLLAAGERRRRLERGGLVVNGREYSMPVVDAEGAGMAADLVVVAVKQHHLAGAISQMGCSVGPESIIISLMNGVESEEQIGKAFGDDLVLPATIVGIDALREGRVITYSKKGKIFFGELTGQKTRRVGRVGALFDRAGIAYEIPSDIRRTIWWKFMINVGVNQASAALRAPYGVFQTPGEARLLMESAMAEVIAVASRLGIPLGEADLADWYAVLKGMSPEGKTSMLQDVEAGRKTEVEMFAGKVIELGRRLGVPTPVNEKLFDLIRKIEAS